ncbi:DNA cytosine methyltransferase [Haloarchaeobius sp. TZWSO28]|uniref:DNA cytosine methyltransferase n=1 Tax=Haloarchaeobius sp. TZWSO28 TaxID=3446119 RepID=UPI003EBE357D
MSSRADSRDHLSVPSVVSDAPLDERRNHRRFLLEHLDFLTDVLTAEQIHRNRDLPVGCPGSTPEIVARRRGTNESFPCRYKTIKKPNGSPAPGAKCDCGDPLVGSDDPLDTVAACAISPSVESSSQHYFHKQERELISKIRASIGPWEEIHQLTAPQLEFVIQEKIPEEEISHKEIVSIVKLLDDVEKLSYTDGVTLNDFSTVPYDRQAEILSSLHGVQENDGWWLLLTAFDKPVWPEDPAVDSILCSLGLLTSSEARSENHRRESLEKQVTSRIIPVLFRGLAAHAWEGDVDACDKDCEIKNFLLSHRIRCQNTAHDGMTAVDLFAGAGGISCGLRQSGFNVKWAIDNNQKATDTYRFNHPEIPHRNIECEDIREIDAAQQIRSEAGVPDIVVGGPPCQSLSQAGYRSRLANDEDYSVLEDERTTLYQEYVEIIRELQPKALVMENVEGILNEVGNTGVKVIKWVIDALEQVGDGPQSLYEFEFRLIDLSKLGIPQKRERVILIGIRKDICNEPGQIQEIFDELVNSSSEVTSIRQALAGLPKLLRGEGGTVVAGKDPGRLSDYVQDNEMCSGTSLSFNHRAREHPMKKDQKLFEEALEPGETGWDVKYKKKEEYAELIDYDVGTEDNPRFKDKYRMLDWEKPSPTVVAHLAKDANSFVLPDYYEYVQEDEEKATKERYRGITPREAARLQSFPDDWVFLGPFTSWFRQIGNAIPPIAGRKIGEALQSVFENTGCSTVVQSGADSKEALSDD